MESVINPTVYYIGVESELIFSVGKEKTVCLKLLSGTTEMFGCELVPNKIYIIPPYSSVSLFSWRGCKVELRGKTEKACISQNTLMMMHVYIHACLEEMRFIANSRNMKGPISLVVGPMQSGKTSFCRLLLNYAARMGRQPLYVDLDVGHNSCSLPGVISVLPVETPLDITDGLNQKALSGFYFGYMYPSKNLTLYYFLVKKLGEMLQARLESTYPKIRNSGVIIDTCGCVKDKGYASIALSAYAFEIDVVFVLQDEDLYQQLKWDMPNCVEVVYVPKQEGIVEREDCLLEGIQDNRVLEYFYGEEEARLKQYQLDVKFSDVEIYRTETLRADDIVADPYKIGFNNVAMERVPIERGLVNHVLGLSFADVADENLVVTSVKGFVCVMGVDEAREVLTVLSPHPGPLSSKILIMGDIKLRRGLIKNV